MDNKKIQLKFVKIGFLGDSSVGKSCICRSIMNLEFDMEMIATIGSEKFETKFTLKNGEAIKLKFWDTAGEERYRSMALNTLKAVSGVIIVFDFTCRSSFENVNSWIELIKENLNNPCLALFGNKSDIPKEYWQVTFEEAQEFAQKNNIKLFLTSARTKDGINEGMSYIVNEAYEKSEQMKDYNIKNIKLERKKKDEYEYVDGCFGKKKKRKKKNKAK